MVGALLFVFFILLLWPRRSEISKAWLQRGVVPATVYWGVAAMYALSGFIPMFSTFWMPRLNVSANSSFAQALTAIGLISLVAVHIFARKLAKPRFEAHAIPARERNEFHSLWLGFWLLGLLAGWLPIFIW
jgi:succinate dehydrogenase hydrophobic anchor subunit